MDRHKIDSIIRIMFPTPDFTFHTASRVYSDLNSATFRHFLNWGKFAGPKSFDKLFKEFSGAPPSALLKERLLAAMIEVENGAKDNFPSATDIELVMAQTNVSREKATETLIKCKNDIVDAIMKLTLDEEPDC